MNKYIDWMRCQFIKPQYLLLIIGFLIFFLGLGLWHYGSSQTKIKKIIPVAVVKVTPQNLSQNITLSAEFQPFTKVTLYAKVSGYLQKINVDIGDRFKKDDVLAILDVPEIRADLAKNKAQHVEAKLNYDRLLKVSQKRPGLIAQEDVDKSLKAFNVTKADHEQAQAFLAYATIKAPLDGVVTKRYVDEGALIQQGTNSSTQAEPLLDIAEDTKLRLTFPIPESAVKDIKVGGPADLNVQSTGKSLKGTIARFSGKIDHATRTMATEIDVDNKDLSLKPGMYATVTIKLDHKDNALALPIQSVIMTGGPHVWSINKNNQLEKKTIKIGLQTPDFIEITEGLNENDPVVFGNPSHLEEGMQVAPKLMEQPSSKNQDGDKV